MALIDQLLDLSKIEAGKWAVDLQNVPPAALVGEVVELIAPMAERQGIAVIARDMPKVLMRADPTALRQILLNFLGNAIKATPPRGIVTIEGHRRPDRIIRVSVSDTGPGIPEGQRSLLFQPFSRLAFNRDHTDGTGIGLYVSKRLIAEMGGKVGVDSVEGVGSTFWVDIPLVAQGDVG